MKKYQYYNTGDDGDRDAYGVNWVDETFTPENTHTIGKVKLKLFRVGLPGTFTVGIRATIGGKAVGGDLCVGTLDGNTLTENSNGEWYEISLGNGFELIKDVQYSITTRAISGDSDNKVSWRADTSSPTYAGGLNHLSSDSGVDWDAYSGVDCMFEEWGVGPSYPSTIVWGALPKSQISAEIIEEAIARLIQDHENDSDAHVEEGESLYSHKAAAIIDHIVDSIIADKIKDWEVIKLGGSFERNDFHWTTIFESIDGYVESVTGTGSVGVESWGVVLKTGATQNSTAIVNKSSYGVFPFTWDKKRKVRFTINPQTVTDLIAYIGTGSDPQVGSRNFVGFKIVDNALYGVVNDGDGETLLDLSVTLVATAIKRLSFTFEPGVYAEFFVDNVSKGKIESGLPSTFSFSYVIFFSYIINNAAANKEIWISSWDLWQEI